MLSLGREVHRAVSSFANVHMCFFSVSKLFHSLPPENLYGFSGECWSNNWPPKPEHY